MMNVWIDFLSFIGLIVYLLKLELGFYIFLYVLVYMLNVLINIKLIDMVCCI